MRFAFITRDWNGGYFFKPEKFKGMSLYSDENLDTGGDCAALCLLEGNTILTAEELYSIWNKFNAGEHENGMVAYRREINGLMMTSWFKEENGIIQGQDTVSLLTVADYSKIARPEGMVCQGVEPQYIRRKK